MTVQELKLPIALAAVVALAAGAYWWSGPDTAVAPVQPGPAGVTRPAAPRARTAGKTTVEDVRLERLQAAAAPMAPPDRNLFRFRTKVAAPSGPLKPAKPVPVPLGPPEPPPPPPPPIVPPPPPIQLKFIGVVDAATSAGRVAVLADAKGNVFYGKEGDIIDGRYRVLKIGVESAELAYVDGRGRQALRLSGQ